jgi:hypothetical protein
LRGLQKFKIHGRLCAKNAQLLGALPAPPPAAALNSLFKRLNSQFKL